MSSFDNHRTGDYTPYLFVTHDYGRTFRSIVNNLPKGGPNYVHVVREDPFNPHLLFVGTDVGCYVSTDDGANWQRFTADLPTVPVFDLKIHPRDHELIAATHGRSIWIVDINPLEQMTAQAVAAPLTVFKPAVSYQYGEPLFDGQSVGQGTFRGTSVPYGVPIRYLVNGSTGGQAHVTVFDVSGDTVASLTGSAANGLQDVTWNFRRTPVPAAPQAQTPAERRDSILALQRVDFVFDSLHKAAWSSDALDRVRKWLTDQQNAGARGRGRGGFGGGGRGRGANPDVWQERPGESFAARGGRGGFGGGRGRGGYDVSAAGADSALAQVVVGLIPQPAGRGRGGFGGFGGGNLTVDAGDYLVTVKVGTHEAKTVVRVERSSGTGGDKAQGLSDDPNGDDPSHR